MNHKILIVDDDTTFIALLKEAFLREPYRVLSAASGDEGLKLLAEEPVDVVVSDEMMPGMKGTDFLAEVRRLHPETVRIMITGHASLQAAIRSINDGGIYRFFTKPCNIFELAFSIRQALQQQTLRQENQRLLRLVKRQCRFMEGLEKDYPGITVVQRGSEGEIILNDEGGELQAILKECQSMGYASQSENSTGRR